MPNDMQHERQRFRTMSLTQLGRRLGKITDRQKLGNFIQLAGECGYFPLRNAAISRYNELYGEGSPRYVIGTDWGPSPVVVVRPELSRLRSILTEANQPKVGWIEEVDRVLTKKKEPEQEKPKIRVVRIRKEGK